MIDVVIIGGGPAGLHTANLLTSILPDMKIIILEKGKYGVPQSRIRSVRDEQGNALYESGAWRINGSHKRTLKLIGELGLEKEILKRPSIPHHSNSSHEIYNTEQKSFGGTISHWDNAVASGIYPSEADHLERSTGYWNQDASALGSRSYHSDSNTDYYTLPNGMTSIIELMLDKISSIDNINVKFGVHVTDVERTSKGRSYKVSMLKRVGSEHFEHEKIFTKHVVLAVPPKHASSFGVVHKWLQPLINAVEGRPLVHVYVKNKQKPVAVNKERILSDSAVSQTHGDDFGKGWYQAVYASGRVAKHWVRMYELLGKDKFVNYVEKTTESTNSIEDVRIHFWEDAVHLWRPAFRFLVEDAVRKSIEPHPGALPKLYWAGEAFSSFQGWLEGALETAEKVVFRLKGRILNNEFQQLLSSAESFPFILFPYIVVDGWVINTTYWEARHPGGAPPIENHTRKTPIDCEDLGSLFRMVGHSKNAWAHIYSMSTGHFKC